jgi:hypothetical protein
MSRGVDNGLIWNFDQVGEYMSSGDQADSIMAERNLEGASDRRVHDEQCVQYTHEMPYDVKEATGRVVIRLVPLFYGFMFGSLTDNMPVAMTIGVLVATALDLGMADKSMARGLFGSLLRSGCPVVAKIAHGLAWAIKAFGLPVPRAMSHMRCGVS